jgi:hypothetical protein
VKLLGSDIILKNSTYQQGTVVTFGKVVIEVNRTFCKLAHSVFCVTHSVDVVTNIRVGFGSDFIMAINPMNLLAVTKVVQNE